MNPLLWMFLLNSRTKTNADGRILHSINVTVIVAVLLEEERQNLKSSFLRNCSGFTLLTETCVLKELAIAMSDSVHGLYNIYYIYWLYDKTKQTFYSLCFIYTSNLSSMNRMPKHFFQ